MARLGTWARRFAVPLGGCAAGLVVAWVTVEIAHRSGPATPASVSAPLAWWLATAGALLVAGGAFTVPHRPGVGVLAVVGGCLWFAPVWEAWEQAPPVAHSIAMVAAGLVFPVLLHLSVSAAGRPMQRAALTLVVATYLIVGGLLLLVTLLRDPYLDPYCWANCTTNVFDVASHPSLARRLVRLQQWGTLVCASALAVACTARLAQAIRPGRRRHWEALPGGLALGLATIASCIEHLHHPRDDPRRLAGARSSWLGARRSSSSPPVSGGRSWRHGGDAAR